MQNEEQTPGIIPVFDSSFCIQHSAFCISTPEVPPVSAVASQLSLSRTPLPLEDAVWRPSFNPWLVALTVTLATFMEVLDTSIANVALPHIAGSLSAGQDESTWVLTSYLVANAIVLPLSGWFSNVLGRK